MSAVFGPVPSRRLGRSLGIDPVPLKTCNFSCVYCQLGRTRRLVDERREHLPEKDILKQVADALERVPAEAIDWITFVASGEPTLHAGLGSMIRRVKDLAPRPVAVITNGSLLHLPAVRRDLEAADAVLPSLDAGSEELFRRIARPHPACTWERLVQGLIAFRQAYHGRLWLEVMLIAGLNDSTAALSDIASVAREIAPDGINISLPSRPPAEAWVECPDIDARARAETILGSVAPVVPAAATGAGTGVSVADDEALLDIITRHPMRREELCELFDGWTVARVAATLTDLEADGRARRVVRHGASFWTAAAARF